ncbi:septation protein SepH [Frondihabitans cladoniiphilus]|uniref:Septation protein SepH n=1 Tax=Frondihabitans cladoniiphilus TaxID=715785 RepID=A0ABP8VP96_9MICO
MQDLKVIGVENGALLVATDAGSEFRLPVTLSLQSQLRAADPQRTVVERKVPPREIQASIRAGRSAEEVASASGVELDYVRRFEGPVLAERSFVLETARAVSVSIATDGDITGQTSRFGDVIDARLDTAAAVDREWKSYKDAEHGWVVHVSYVTHEVERDATWRFDPKKQSLAPLNGDAHTLSRQDAEHTNLVPRLRAVGPAASTPDDSGRFDSGAFEVTGEPVETSVAHDGTPFDRSRAGDRSAASIVAMNRAPEAAPEHNQTADLLEALRRRRGEREAARFDDADPRSNHPSTGSIRVIDVPLDDFDEPEHSEPPRVTKPLATHPAAASRFAPDASTAPAPDGDSTGDQPTAGRPVRAERAPEPARPARARRGRASMPSWDEIVFGARSDDDPS